MGQIVIDIPKKANRRYLLQDEKQAELLISALDISAVRIKRTPASIEELEDAADLRNVKKAMSEFKKTGKVRPWAEVESELGL